MTTTASTSVRGPSSPSSGGEPDPAGLRAILRARLRTTPARLWMLTLASVLAMSGLFVSAFFTLDRARGGSEALEDAWPQATATTDLYLALAEMDAQMADALLMGADHGLGPGREATEERYESSRVRANEALLQAASLTEGDTIEENNVQAVLDGLGDYESITREALVLNDEAGAPPGEVDEAALDLYREGSRLMHTDLMPKAFNLGLDSSAIVRAEHEQGREAVALGLLWVGGTGVLTVGVLAGLQIYLRGRFRRRFNAPLLAVTAVTAALAVGVITVLNSSAGHQVRAKEEGLDAAMALFRARAVATDMQADQSRYLLDPGQADNHQQVYLERAQAVLFRPADNLEEYYGQVAEVAESYPDPPGEGERTGTEEGGGDPGTLGYLGEDAQEPLGAGEREALGEVIAAYDTLQSQDRRMRALAEDGDRSGAIDTRMDIVHHEEGAFAAYTDSLDGLIALHGERFESGVGQGGRALDPKVWGWLLPVGALLALALIVLGVRPRLAEYR